MRINIRSFALASSLLWGLGLFALTWWIILFEGPTREITLIGRIFRGYSISPSGSIMGLLWGLLVGFLTGGTFAWFYDLIAGRGASQNTGTENARK